jgi:hypothetical protein
MPSKFRLMSSVAPFIALCASLGATPTKAAAPNGVSLPATFIENKGQWDPNALFLSQSKGLNVWLTRQGAVYDFNRFIRTPNAHHARVGHVQGHIVRMSFVKARSAALVGQNQTSGVRNYFIGADRRTWAAGVRGFSQALSTPMYEGVSVRYSMENGAPRYDVLVKPGADPSQVGLRIEGAQRLQVLANGNLSIKTSLGVVEERGLTAYQQAASGLTQVPCRMVLQDNVVRFDVGSYDAAKTLVIDPILYSTFLGGATPGDIPNGVAIDSQDNVYVVGQAISPNFPVTTGAYQTSDTDSSGIAFLTKLNQQENTLVYSTFIGGVGNGSAGDSAVAVAVDKSFDAYVTGFTSSPTFPTTANAFQTTNKEATNRGPNGFVTKFNPAGSGLVYSTYLGGSGAFGFGDTPTAIALDSKNDAYVVGGTYSADFTTGSSAFQKTDKEPAATQAGFITELGPGGLGIIFSTFLAGTGDGGGNGDIVNAVTVDGTGNIYVAGTTYSNDFPVTTGAFQSTNHDFLADQPCGFVAKFPAGAATQAFSTFLGGTSGDMISGIAVDTLSNVTVAGATFSLDFPVTPTAFMVWNPESTSTAPIPSCAFVTKLASTGKSLVFSTYLGGSGGSDNATSLKMDGANNAVVAGFTGSSDFPVTNGAFQTVYQEPPTAPSTGFISKVSANGTALLYGTFLGGSDVGGDSGDQISALAMTTGGSALVVGATGSADFPTSGGAYDKQYASGFVVNMSTTTAATTIADFALSPSPCPAGTQALGTISLNNSTASDLDFTLTSTGPAIIPTSVTIPAGSASGSFQFLTEGVNANTMVSITAQSGTLSKMMSVTVVPAILPNDGLVLNQTGVAGGSSVSATVSLAGYGGYRYTAVNLTSSNPAAASVPATVDIPYNTPSAKTTIKTAAVSASINVTITATLGTHTATATLLVREARAALLTIPISTVGGTTVHGTILLSSPAGPTGDVVTLSSNSANATVAASVTVPAGATSASFNIVTKAVTTNTSATITASCAGQSQTGTIQIQT